ncbi:SLC13 family permease [Acuticoccus kandeliae]|uniref:SLC13 family permease n=1 Tax=Acuticoccus kandeliae TaxID=2073160 RepID=UPI00196AEE3C|nr:SLC13 family permease [Acuticoccus kandeliae]
MTSFLPEAVQPFVGLALLVLTFAAFATELLAPSAVAIIAAGAFIALGILTIDDVASVLASPALITIAAMFVISGALVRTGTLEAVATWITKRAETHPSIAIASVLLGALAASAFVNNMPVVLVLIPVVIRLAGTVGIASTKLLIPLSYFAILGGTCTLIGTSTNLVVAGVAQSEGLAPFSIFEITPVGLVAAAAGTLMILLTSRWLLPDRDNHSEAFADDDRAAFLTEIALTGDFAEIGTKLGELRLVRPDGLHLLALRRGGKLLRDGIDEEELREGDRLVLKATREEILSLEGVEGVIVGKTRRRDFTEEALVAEAFLAPSRQRGRQRIADIALLQRVDIALLGVHRDGHLPGESLDNVILRPADRIMVRGEPDAIGRLARSNMFVSLNRTESRPFRRGRAPIAILGAAAVVVLAALGIAPIGALAMIAVAAILILRCIDAEEAWDSIDGGLLVLVFAMLAIGLGLQKAGTIEMVVDWIAPTFASAPPFLFILGLYLLTSLLTELVTNNAVAVIFTPIAILLANEAGHDPRAAVIAVMVAASASFATPVGYQTNTLVYGAGDYRFSDFMKIGIPMNIVVGLASCLAIQWFW